MLNMLRRNAVAPLGVLGAVLALAAPAAAAPPAAATAVPRAVQVRPLAPYGPCGDHFHLTRSGRTVRVVGTDLKAFSSSYMLVFASANGRGFGPYNASPYGGANFSFDSGSSSRTTVGISLTNDSNTATLCASNYYV